MKHIITILLFYILLTGCTLSPKFNPVEYDHYARMAAISMVAAEHCDRPQNLPQFIAELRIGVRTSAVYAQYLPKNTKAYEATQIMLDIIEEMHTRYSGTKPPSRAYCKLKLKNIQNASIRIMEAVGEKPNDR